MKHVKLIIMSSIMILMYCSLSIAESSSGIGINGNVGTAPIGLINNGAHVYPLGEQGAHVYPLGEQGAHVYPLGEQGVHVYPVGEHGAGISQPLREFVCNSMSACGIFDPAWVSNGAIVNQGEAGSGAIVNLGGA